MTYGRRLLPAAALLLPVAGLVPAVSGAGGNAADVTPAQQVDTAPAPEVDVAPVTELPPEQRYTTPEDQFWHGFNLLYGRGIPKNPVEANVWFRKAAERGQVRAQVHLGMSYMKGRGIAPNRAKGLEWLALAAEQNHSKAQTEVGIAYFTGHSVRRDRVEGLKWLALAVEGGGLVARTTAPNYIQQATPKERELARVLVREWRIAHGLPVPELPEAEDSGSGS